MDLQNELGMISALVNAYRWRLPEVVDRPQRLEDIGSRLDGAIPLPLLESVLRILVQQDFFYERNGWFERTERSQLLLPGTLGSLSPQLQAMSVLAQIDVVSQLRTNSEPRINAVPLSQFLFDHPGAAWSIDSLHQQQVDTSAWTAFQQVSFATVRSFVLIGGGRSSFLAKILHVYPHMSITLVDYGAALEDSKAKLSPMDIHRCHFVEVEDDFLSVAIPPNGDAYLFYNLFSRWDEDDTCLAFLRHCSDLISADGQIYLLEPLLRSNDDDERAVLLDMQLLFTGQGRLRKKEELRSLLLLSGFVPVFFGSPDPVTLIEVRKCRE